MLLLAVETATPQVGVALWGPDGLLSSTRLAGGRRHGEALAPAIAAALASAGAAARDLTGLAVDVGPGLFTGLRVGLATVKALGDALDLPVVGLPSLQVLAEPHRRQPHLVAAVVDARRGEVFRALYRPGPDGFDEVAAPDVLAPAALAAELGERREPVLAVGDGARRYAGELLGGAGAPVEVGSPVEVGGPLEAHPDPAVLAGMAVPVLAAGGGQEAATLRPCYLRPADVRIGWEQRPTPAGTRG